MNKALSRQDFARWTAEQARALREAGAARLNTPEPIDWDDVAEEIESLGRSERTALRSRLRVIVEHLLKLAASPAAAPRADWMATIRAQRTEIDALIADSPSLVPEIPGLLDWALPRARRDVAAALADRREQPLTDLDTVAFTVQQVTGVWFPANG